MIFPFCGQSGLAQNVITRRIAVSAALENGIDAFALSSGMAAISLLMEMCKKTIAAHKQAMNNDVAYNTQFKTEMAQLTAQYREASSGCS